MPARKLNKKVGKMKKKRLRKFNYLLISKGENKNE